MPPEQKDDITVEEQRTLIERALATWGFRVESWDDDPEDRRLRAWLGEVEVVEEDDGLYDGDGGQLYATVVGAKQYSNVHVAFYLLAEGMNEPMRCNPGNVEPV